MSDNTEKRIRQLNSRIKSIDDGKYYDLAIFSAVAILAPAIGITIVTNHPSAAIISSSLITSGTSYIFNNVSRVRKNAMNELHTIALEENKEHTEERHKNR